MKPKNIATSNERPVRIRMESESGEVFFLTVYPRFFTITPKGSRKADAVVEMTPLGAYRAGVAARIRAERPARRTVKRGLLTL